MAVLLNDANSEFLVIADVIRGETPLTLACWFKSDDLAVNKALVSICDSAGDENYFELRAASTASGQIIRAGARSSAANSSAVSASQYSNNVWHHAGAVFASSTSRIAYLDGVGGTPLTTSVTPAGLDRTGIGCLYRNGIVFYMSGDIAEVGIWKIDLSVPDMVSLSKGYSPLLVKPKHLVAYFPLIREGAAGVYRDLIGGLLTSESGGSAPSAHPRVIYPQGPQISSVVPIGLSIPVAMHHYRNMRVA